MGLNKAVKERIEAMEIDDPLTRRIHIKMSGCPNGCSQHHIANIGFYGASIKVGEHTRSPPRSRTSAAATRAATWRYGQRLKARLPAKRVPDAVERWIRLYEANRDDGEEFNAFADARRAPPTFEAQVEGPLDAAGVQPRDDEPSSWTGPDEPFEVVRGEGECAV